MIDMIAQYVHKVMEAATPWLVGTAAGLFVLWLIMLCYKAKPFAKELKWFFSLTPWHKFIVVCVFCFFTLWGGSKERGILPSGLIDDISSTVTRVVETIQLRTLPENISMHLQSRILPWIRRIRRLHLGLGGQVISLRTSIRVTLMFSCQRILP